MLLMENLINIQIQCEVQIKDINNHTACENLSLMLKRDISDRQTSFDSWCRKAALF